MLDHAPASLTHREAWVLGVLARDANDTTRLTFTPIEDPMIMRRARVSRPQLYAVLNALVEKGALERATAGQKNSRAKYRILPLDRQRLGIPDTDPPQRPGTPDTDPGPADPETTQTAPKKPPASDLLEGFDEFWAAYPRRIAKAPARAAWSKAIKRGAMPADITAAATRAAAQWRRQNTETKFIPHPATWLNGERYDDEPEPTPASQPQLPGTGRYADPAERGIF
ncbi:hypothetical protein J3A78_003835 [Streptomyces sp. PvR006]|uniref:hypothetical protein n=1 Tax=Streptomyces sp. PvR006 TaxID=2817860 RepID=UPI001AE4D51A|nr:hypothetical protein [Streptomyces sp. PvR006]MBP2583357.1 hypothetical protein [Streptomyces sp. PvR006]